MLGGLGLPRSRLSRDQDGLVAAADTAVDLPALRLRHVPVVYFWGVARCIDLAGCLWKNLFVDEKACGGENNPSTQQEGVVSDGVHQGLLGCHRGP